VERRRVWAGALAVAVLVALAWWLSAAGAAVDRQRNDAMARVVQLDAQLDQAKKDARAARKATVLVRSGWAQLHAAPSSRPRSLALKAIADGGDAFRTSSRAMLEAFATLGLYQGDIRAARQTASGAAAYLEDAVWSYGHGSLADGDRAFAHARLAFDNFFDAAGDLWRSALGRRNQPLDDARRLQKPFPASLVDHPQFPPNRSDALEASR